MKWFDNFVSSLGNALSLGNLFKRLLYFLLFGFILGINKLIYTLNVAGANGGSFMDFVSAFSKSLKYGLGIAHATVWDVIVDLFSVQVYFQDASWGTWFFTGVFFLALIGFWFQPVSIIMNVLDMKGRKETGSETGQASSWVLRFGVTIILVIILSWFVFASDMSESIAAGEAPDGVGVLNESVVVNSSLVNDSFVEPNSTGAYIDMLSGGG